MLIGIIILILSSSNRSSPAVRVDWGTYIEGRLNPYEIETIMRFFIGHIKNHDLAMWMLCMRAWNATVCPAEAPEWFWKCMAWQGKRRGGWVWGGVDEPLPSVVSACMGLTPENFFKMFACRWHISCNVPITFWVNLLFLNTLWYNITCSHNALCIQM